MIQKYFVSLLFALMPLTLVIGQKGALKSANKFYEAGLYKESIDYFNEYQKIEKDKKALYRRGVANFMVSNFDEAIKDLTKAYTLDIDKDEVYYYVGRAMQGNQEFADAIKFYKNYLRFVEDKEVRYEVIDRIKRCAYGMNSKYNDQLAFVENLGNSVNSPQDEVRPIQSPTNQNKYYFSSNRDNATGGRRNEDGLKDEIYGKYRADMYAVELNDGNWTAVGAFHPLLNGPRNDVLQAFDPSGRVMYFLRSLDGENGEMLTDTFSTVDAENAFPKKLQLPIVSELGDKDLIVYNDNLILFSSQRKGGYGGYDLYMSRLQDSMWTNPVNLGPSINTAYDEVSPYITKGGNKLYFSSDRLTSMGGFDIFGIDFAAESGTWSETYNLGKPINSGSDDLDFSISADGTVGLLSSNRSGGKGGYDIFMAYMKDQITDQLQFTDVPNFVKVAMANDTSEIVSGQLDNDNTLPKVKVREYLNSPLYYGQDENILTPQNTELLKGLADLLVIFPDVSVILTCHAIQEGMREFDLYFSIKRAEKAAEYLKDEGIAADRIMIRGVGSNFPLAQPIVNGRVSRLAEKNNRRIDIAVLHDPKVNLKVINDLPVVSENFRDERGYRYSSIVSGLSYKVVINTVKQMYKGEVLQKYDHATIEKRYSDELYNYTLGLFDQYNQARQFEQLLIREGLPDAKVVPYMDGKSLSLQEAIGLQENYPDLQNYLNF